TSQSAFSRQDVSVLRRFSDFLWLFTVLQSNNPGVIVPPVPDKHPFGRFAEDFVETRRNALEQCLQKMANHPVLQLDPDLRLFLESDTLSMEMKNRKAEVASEQKGYLASLTSTLSGPKYYERDEWFDQKKLVLDTLESQLKILVKSIELVSKQRLDLAVATSDFAEAIASLAASDLSKQLSHALERLADIGRRSRDVHEDNAKGDVRTFMTTADEYIRLIASVRLAFASRVKTYLSWQSLEAESRRLRTNLEKARKAGKIPQERVGMEIQIVAEAERRSKEAQAEYESVSRLVKNEFVRFETERVEDFKIALERFLEGMIKRQKIVSNPLLSVFHFFFRTFV
ncbi:Vps5 C terminal like-domain-containing protein, partial [Mrakia frigida]|uniref:sorting nexin 1 n=1 Tax=Mrakia frigida TaxID=29902 RepID=UPI003FCBEF0D